MKEELLQEIYEIKGEIIRSFSTIRKDLFGVKDVVELLNMQAWVKSRLKSENGNIEIQEDGYGGKILVIKLEDPWTDNWAKKENKTAFIIYFSFQISKPIVPSQLFWKLNQIYKITNKLRARGYHVFPGIVAFKATPGAQEILRKHKVPFFNNVEEVMTWIYNKIIFRLQKLVEVAKFTFKFDKIFLFLKKIIEGIGFEIPREVLEAWAYKPKYPRA
jgi:hypothetical protein